VNVSKRLALSVVAVAGIATAMPAMASGNPHNQAADNPGVACNEGTVTWDPQSIWPPNHKMIPVKITYTESNDNDGDTTAVTVMGVTETDGTNAPQDATVAETLNGSGKPGQIDAAPHDNTGDPTTGSDTTPATYTEDIRAERSGTDGHGSGRTYTITVQCTDSGSSDNAEPSSGSATIKVFVPHDQGVVKSNG
jgi:hypothetical protein